MRASILITVNEQTLNKQQLQILKPCEQNEDTGHVHTPTTCHLSRTQNNLEETEGWLFQLDLDSPQTNAETRSQLVQHLQRTAVTTAEVLNYFLLSNSHSRDLLTTGEQASKLYLLLGLPPSLPLAFAL
jgi:hypothetical protein